MPHRIRGPLTRCLARRPAADFCVYTRVLGTRVELRASHLPSGHLFVASADRFDQAAEELGRLIELVSPDTIHPARPVSAGLEAFWQHASHAVAVALRRLRG